MRGKRQKGKEGKCLVSSAPFVDMATQLPTLYIYIYIVYILLPTHIHTSMASICFPVIWIDLSHPKGKSPPCCPSFADDDDGDDNDDDCVVGFID